MKLLITGANGFVAKNFIKYYGELGNLCLLDRDPIPDNYHSKTIIKNIDSKTNYADCIQDVDCIIHCAARVHLMSDESSDPLKAYREVNTAGTINFAKQAIDAGVKRFIFISSIKVNGENTNDAKPFSSHSPRMPEDFYGRSKSEAEEALLELSKSSSLEVVIIRPTLVYGPGVKANFASLMRLAGKGIPLPFSCVSGNLRSLVSVRNLVDLICVCIRHPKANGEIFLVSDEHDISTSDMARMMSRAMNKSVFQIPVPVWCFRLIGKLFRREDMVERLIGSLQVDISHTKNTLNWTPPQSMNDAFKETADYIRNHKV